MTKYLLSFPAAAMVVTPEELPDVVASSHAMVQEAKDAGVWVFGGGIDDSIPPVRVDGEGGVHADTYAETAQLDGGFTILDLPTEAAAYEWAAKFAIACRCPQEVRAFGEDAAS